MGKVLKAHQKEPISIDEKMVSDSSNGPWRISRSSWSVGSAVASVPLSLLSCDKEGAGSLPAAQPVHVPVSVRRQLT